MALKSWGWSWALRQCRLIPVLPFSTQGDTTCSPDYLTFGLHVCKMGTKLPVSSCPPTSSNGTSQELVTNASSQACRLRDSGPRPSTLEFHKLSRWYSCLLRCENHWTTVHFFNPSSWLQARLTTWLECRHLGDTSITPPQAHTAKCCRLCMSLLGINT